MRALAVVHQRDAGSGVFADAVHASGWDLDQWLRAETDTPPEDPERYDAVMVFGGAMHADHEERHPWLREEKALLAELLERGVPLLGRMPRVAAARRGGRRVRAPGERSRDRLA